MATFTGNASINFIRPGFVSNGVVADPAGSKPSAAADILDGRGGADIMDGGDGDDIYFVDNAGDVTEEANMATGGIDRVNASVSYRLSAALEDLVLTGQGDLDGTGNGRANALTGNAGDNTLDGRGGDDRLDGGGGRDRLSGGYGADTLDGGSGADSMDGGDGGDTYFVDNEGDVAAETAGGPQRGVDLVLARADHSLGLGIENLTLQGVGSISGGGNALANHLRGNDGANTLDGLQGDDILAGGRGNDVLLGGLGDDILRGEGGADTLQGGAETDILIGGFGNDVFDFNLAGHSTRGARDTIRGEGGAAAFEGIGAARGDRIDLSGIDADAGRAGNQAFVFGGAGVGHLSVVDDGGITVVRGDTAAGGGFEFQVAIEDGLVGFAINYTPADFVL